MSTDKFLDKNREEGLEMRKDTDKSFVTDICYEKWGKKKMRGKLCYNTTSSLPDQTYSSEAIKPEFLNLTMASTRVYM